MQDMIVCVIQLHRGMIVVGIVALGLMSFKHGLAGHGSRVLVLRHIDSAEAFRRDVFFQPPRRKRIFPEHGAVLFKALLPGNLERGNGFRCFHGRILPV